MLHGPSFATGQVNVIRRDRRVRENLGQVSAFRDGSSATGVATGGAGSLLTRPLRASAYVHAYILAARWNAEAIISNIVHALVMPIVDSICEPTM